ncbi:MAG: FAD:protein FMN transferase [Ardenticatenaceae bacterium]|nr:FAD:protein FMN transferase [Ardenticatenaceae bacterium]
MQTRNFYAMGSHMTVWLDSDEDVLEKVIAAFRKAENRYSRFLPYSELSQLNQRPEQWVVVSPDFWQILNHALYLAHATGGLFDPTILPALEAAGYDRSFERLQNSPITQNQTGPIDYRQIELDAVRRAVWLSTGVQIDLGGIAKGYTAQRVVCDMKQWGPCLIDAGGDLVAGDAPSGWPGWPVGVAAPYSYKVDPENLLRLWLSNGTLATSGIDYRRWQQGLNSKHHIIDPLSGDSASTDLLTASVVADDASTAEAWATAALVAGKTRTLDLFNDYRKKAALIDQNRELIITEALESMVQYA